MYSAVIAALPGDPMLVEAIDSIRSQTLPPVRIEVVIDDVTAEGRRWISAVQRRRGDISFLVQEGRGMASALAVGIRRVSTPYVAFLDCDDLWLPEKQDRQVSLLEASPDIDAVMCRSQNTRANGDAVGAAVESAMFTATTFRTATFSRLGMPDAEASHYVWLYRWWAAARQAGIRTSSVDYVGLHRRIHGGNSWIRGREAAHRDLMAELRRQVAQRRAAVQ